MEIQTLLAQRSARGSGDAGYGGIPIVGTLISGARTDECVRRYVLSGTAKIVVDASNE